MLLPSQKVEVCAGPETHQVPRGMYELSTPVVTTFMPGLDEILREGDTSCRPSNIYDSSQVVDAVDYPLLAAMEEPFLPLKDFPVKSKGSHLLAALTTHDAAKRNTDKEAFLAVSHQTTEPFEASFRIKCEPMASDQLCCRNDTFHDHNLDEVQSLVMEHLNKEVRDTCETLYISPNPREWSNEDVHKWILFTLRQYNQPMILMEFFSMNGISFCSLPESSFRQRAGPAGECLYARLELWKAASGFYRQDPCSSAAPLEANFQPDDSFLDITAFFQMTPQHQQQPLIPPSPYETSRDSQSPVSMILSPENSSNHTLSTDYSGDERFQSDDDLSEDNLEVNEKLGAINSSESDGRNSSSKRYVSHSHIHLWQFLKELLSQDQQYASCIRWVDRAEGIFRIEDSVRVARLWGKRKNRPAMNYDKLSRSIRQYYKKGIMKKTERSQRLVYQFCHPYCL